MANTFLKPTAIAALALELERRAVVLPRLVTRLGLSDFRGVQGDTITMRVPAILTAREYEWRTRTAEIVLDELEELGVDVTLDTHLYSAVGVTDEELTLDIADFGVQVLQPQVNALVERMEDAIATVMEGATFGETDIPYVEGSSEAAFYEALVDARAALNRARVPLSGRAVVIGSNVEAAALKEEAVRNASQSGSTDALRRAELGQLAGFTIYVAPAVDPDFAVAFHRTAFAFANVAPAVPAGVAFGASRQDDGLAMRWIRDYDARYLRDRSVVSSFVGASSVMDGRDPAVSPGTPGELNDTNVRAVKIAFTGAGS